MLIEIEVTVLKKKLYFREGENLPYLCSWLEGEVDRERVSKEGKKRTTSRQQTIERGLGRQSLVIDCCRRNIKLKIKR
ncbi:hypothetical protein Syun_000662 [Stephania yunnanensis]|uniref:Uncharacterized protein n=1 Tax=Stephania yunnanensis TaxID=152371 RepID=A0AAP0LCB1_9MAGN